MRYREVSCVTRDLMDFSWFYTDEELLQYWLQHIELWRWGIVELVDSCSLAMLRQAAGEAAERGLKLPPALKILDAGGWPSGRITPAEAVKDNPEMAEVFTLLERWLTDLDRSK